MIEQTDCPSIATYLASVPLPRQSPLSQWSHPATGIIFRLAHQVQILARTFEWTHTASEMKVPSNRHCYSDQKETEQQLLAVIALPMSRNLRWETTQHSPTTLFSIVSRDAPC